MVKKKGIRLPLVATLMLMGVFVFGGLAGAFVYAAGKAVIETPKMVMVSHTEYRYGEAGQIVARLVDFQGNPVVVTNCTATILYPDKSFYINAQLMTDTGNIAGDHYYNFTSPNGPEGVYEYQATCYYSPNKQASVTNSFHLSSALGNLLSNQTAQNLQLTYIQGNLTQVQDEVLSLGANVSAMNVSLGAQITALSGQLNTNITTLYDQANSNLATVQSQLNANTTQILAAISAMNVSVNLTPVTDAIAALDAAMAANFTYTNGLITTLSGDMASNFSVVASDLQQINTTANSIYSAVLVINTTTQSIYTYLTTTLVGKVDQVLADLGVINATVNRIETVSNVINSTTQTILQNQQDAVDMSVFSG